MIYLIITTSINNKIGINNENHRKTRYINSIQQVLDLINLDTFIKPIIVENNGERTTYLDTLNCDVCYTNSNNKIYKHKGVNELLDIKTIIKKYNIQDEDTIIKLTGRYKLLDDSFIQTVKEHCNNYDAFIKFFNVCTLKYMVNDCVLGLFAIKGKYIKHFNYQLKQSPECEFACFVRQNVQKDKVMEINKLKLECCFADDLRLLTV